MKTGLIIYAIGVVIFLTIYGRRVLLDWIEELEYKKMGIKSDTDTLSKVLLDRQIGWALVTAILSWLSLIVLAVLFGSEELKRKELKSKKLYGYNI